MICLTSRRTYTLWPHHQVTMFNEFVASTRIRAARNVSGYALPAGTCDEVSLVVSYGPTASAPGQALPYV